MARSLLPLLTAVCVFAADKKPIEPAQSGNDAVEVIGAAHVGRQDAIKLLGHDPGFELIVIDVRVIPKLEEKLRLYLDDFTLISNKDGQRSQPLAPSQIAGKGSLVVSSAGGQGGISTGPSFGGMGGVYGGIGGPPSRLGGDGATIGNTSQSSATASVHTGAHEKDNPLLAVLKKRVLAEGETGTEQRGLLYFIFEGKHKLKDLDLVYKSPKGRVILDFQR